MRKKNITPKIPWALVVRIARAVLADGNLMEWLYTQKNFRRAELDSLRQPLRHWKRTLALEIQFAAIPLDQRPSVRVLSPAWCEISDPYVVGHLDDSQLADAELLRRWRDWCKSQSNVPPSGDALDALTEMFEAFLEQLEQEKYFGLRVADKPLEFPHPDDLTADT